MGVEDFAYEARMGVCAVCSRPPALDNLLVYCDGKNCNIGVHKGCYGIVDLPPGQQKWYCKRCEPFSTVRATKVKCCLCPNRPGALKPTTNHEEFCHVVCAHWLPGVSFVDQARLEPIDVSKANRTLSACYICLEEKRDKDAAMHGVVASCSSPGCDRAMHVTCAQARDLMRGAILDGKLDPSDSKRKLYCESHMHLLASPTASPSKDRAKSGQDNDGSLAGLRFRVGDAVQAYWRNGKKLYAGFITAINVDARTYSIKYHDGDYEDGVIEENVKPMSSGRTAKHVAAKTLAEQASKDKLMKEKIKEQASREKIIKDKIKLQKPVRKSQANRDKDDNDNSANKPFKRKSVSGEPVVPNKRSKPLMGGKHKSTQHDVNTPLADSFCSEVAQVLKKEELALSQLVMHDNLSGIDMKALATLSKAKASAEDLMKRLDTIRSSLTKNKEKRAILDEGNDSFDAATDLHLRSESMMDIEHFEGTLAALFGLTRAEIAELPGKQDSVSLLSTSIDEAIRNVPT